MRLESLNRCLKLLNYSSIFNNPLDDLKNILANVYTVNTKMRDSRILKTLFMKLNRTRILSKSKPI